ncbi:MAG: DUF4105 domain-containing protein [Bacteriovoracaceae bacterium]
MFRSLSLWPVLFLFFLTLPGRADVFDQTKKISLIYVGPARGLESSFGHVALKLSPDKDGGLLDLVVEFVADIPRNENPMKKYIHGAGLGKKYPVKADLSSFYDFKKLKTINENRTLTVFDLKLTDEEVAKAVDFIRHYQERELGENYLFLTKNCSYFAAHTLEVATGRKINNKNFPWKVDDNLRKEGLVEQTTKFQDGASERVRIAKKFADEGVGSSFPEEWKASFLSMLAERNITLRQSSYLKLLWLLNSEAPEKEKKKAQSLLRYLLSFENDVNQFTIKNLFRNPDKKKIISLQNIRLEGAELPKASTFKHELVIEHNHPIIHVSWSGENSANVSIPLPQISFTEDLALTYKKMNVGRYIRTKSDKWILSQRLDYGLDVDVFSSTVRTFLYIDLSENVKSIKDDYDTLKARGIVALNNAIDFKGEAGSCYALVLLQKGLLERAIFMPEVSPWTSIDKFSVMKDIFNGKFAIIAGYKNIADFTGDIPKEELKKFIRTLQASLQKDKFSQMAENVLERELFDKVTEKRVKAMLNEGLFVPLIIGMSEKGKLKPASDYAHVILLHDMKKIDEGYRLTAYDPNTGLNSLFVLNKNFRLEYPFYDKNYDYVGMIDRINAEAMTIDHAVRSRGVDSEKVRGLLQNNGARILEVSEITRILP